MRSVPKSKTLVNGSTFVGWIHAAMVKSVRSFAIPSGSATLVVRVRPFNSIPLPNRPWLRPTLAAGQIGGVRLSMNARFWIFSG